MITRTQSVANSNWERVKQQSICQIKPREIQITQHQFNPRTVYTKQRTSTHVTWISQLLDLSLFVWLDAVTTPVDKKQVNSCVLNHLFGGSSATQKNATTPKNAFADALLMSSFQNFAAACHQKQTTPCSFMNSRCVSLNWLIYYRINAGPNILRIFVFTGHVLWMTFLPHFKATKLRYWHKKFSKKNKFSEPLASN